MSARPPPAGPRGLADLFLFRRHDALERRVRSWLMPLWIVSTAGSGIDTHWNQPPSSSRLTRRRRRPSLDFHDDRGVRQPEPLGQHDTGLREPLIVGLKAR